MNRTSFVAAAALLLVTTATISAQRPDKNTVRGLIAKGEVISISARTNRAYVIGALPMRSVICLQYVGGLWKGWGNIPTDNPDDAAAEGGDRSRLAIVEVTASGKQRVVAVVPPNTKNNPFAYVVSHDMKEVVLRMNDNDGAFEKNPDKGVKYRFFLQRP
ncbi:MAG: hypothetical protein HZC54_04150 [Verrucomicrobia bacterium]|nr:hypothetical protein [Verrucomicrobiota bacterium]